MKNNFEGGKATKKKIEYFFIQNWFFGPPHEPSVRPSVHQYKAGAESLLSRRGRYSSLLHIRLSSVFFLQFIFLAVNNDFVNEDDKNVAITFNDSVILFSSENQIQPVL